MATGPLSQDEHMLWGALDRAARGIAIKGDSKWLKPFVEAKLPLALNAAGRTRLSELEARGKQHPRSPLTFGF